MTKGNGPSISDIIGMMASGNAKLLHSEETDDAVRAVVRVKGDFEVTITHEAQMMELATHGMQYINGNPFEPGEWVTPKAMFGIKGAGQPHFVLAVRDADPNFITGSEGSAKHGGVLDMRVACYVENDSITAFWVESWQYEEYEAE